MKKVKKEKTMDTRIWTHIGGDLEASYDGKRYVDVRGRGRKAGKTKSAVFMSRGTLKRALKLFRPAPIAE